MTDSPRASGKITMYHNPACGTSRNVLAMLKASGETPEVIEYLVTPSTRETLESLIAAMGGGPRPLLRRKGTPYDELNLDDPTLSDATLIDAMLANPILINRPIVVTPQVTRLCRPSEAVLALLDNPVTQYTKEDGDVIHAPKA